MTNIFDAKETQNVIERINQLKPTNRPQWGKMTADQMLAHCNVTYEMVYTDKHKKPNVFTKVLLKLFVKKWLLVQSHIKEIAKQLLNF
jgi:Na+/citrate or Na+/malate symporter